MTATDRDGQRWAVDRFGIPIKVNGERIPGPANIIDPHADRIRGCITSQGHCGLCGSLHLL